MVRDDTGVPLANTTVEVHYRRGDGASSAPSVCPFSDFCWFGVKTDAAGFYSATFHAVPATHYLMPGLVGVVNAFGGDDHEANTQLLWPGPIDIVQNFWLRRLRTISAGQSTTVTINSESSRCTDLEDLFALGSQCETVAVRVDAPGTLVVEARAADGGAAPSVYWYTSGDYTAPGVRAGPSAVSLVVYPGTVRILVGTLAGASARRFDVLTSLR